MTLAVSEAVNPKSNNQLIQYNKICKIQYNKNMHIKTINLPHKNNP